MYVDKDNSLKSILDQHFALQCPSCQALSNVTPISVPRFEMLARFKPKNVGLVYRCDSCNYPIFLKFGVKGYGAERVDLSPTFEQVELPVETFDYTYLPEEVERDFREALACFSISSFNAFGSMCRRTMQRVFADLGEAGKMKIFNQLKEVGELAELDADTYRVLEKSNLWHRRKRAPEHAGHRPRSRWFDARGNQRHSLRSLCSEGEAAAGDAVALTYEQRSEDSPLAHTLANRVSDGFDLHFVEFRIHRQGKAFLCHSFSMRKRRLLCCNEALLV